MANWGEWELPYAVCDLYLAADVMCSTSSIFHLVAISVDRFFAVTSPILYSQHRHNTTPGFAAILACWAVSLAIGLPIMCGLNHRPEPEPFGGSFNTSNVSLGWSNTTSPSPEEPLICAFYNPDFIIWSSVGSFYIPCLIMVVLYFRIFKTLCKRALLQSQSK